MKTRRKIQQTHDTLPRRGNFNTIIRETTQNMPPYQQRFSSFIHLKKVSAASDFIGRTVARPNPVLFGAVASFFTTLGLYLLSKNLGYSLSGFESIGAFGAGWIIGLLFDFTTHLRKKNQS